jgi:integrase
VNLSTFATEYLRRGGEMERLRRILGHTTYVMVMRYVHLDKGDLGKDFDERSPSDASGQLCAAGARWVRSGCPGSCKI